jgi:hypothetical protein
MLRSGFAVLLATVKVGIPPNAMGALMVAVLALALVVIFPPSAMVPVPCIVEPVIFSAPAIEIFTPSDKVFNATIDTLPVTVSAKVPLIVDVPALNVVMEAKVFAASIFKVPPALICTVLPAVIVLALTVFPVVIIVCPKAPLTKNKPAITSAKNFDLRMGKPIAVSRFIFWGVVVFLEV